MRIVCQQRILMKYHTLFVIFEKAANFEIVVCCKVKVALYGLKLQKTLLLLFATKLLQSNRKLICDNNAARNVM